LHGLIVGTERAARCSSRRPRGRRL
jgi:hypothetical protein